MLRQEMEQVWQRFTSEYPSGVLRHVKTVNPRAALILEEGFYDDCFVEFRLNLQRLFCLVLSNSIHIFY